MRHILFLILLFVSQVSKAASYDISEAESKVEWKAVGTKGVKMTGKSTKLTGHLTVDKGMAAGEFKVDMNSFTTGIKMRDDHTKNNYLEVQKYPESVFVLNAVKLSSKFSASGQLTLHGKTKEVGFDCQAGKSEGRKKIACLTKVDMSDFGIEVPEYGGIEVAKEVAVKVSIRI